MPTTKDIFFIICMGVLATISQLSMTKAYSLAKGGIVGTIGYSIIIFSIILGMLLGDAFPSFFILTGIALIIFSGFLVSYTKTK
jgi:drug/metabolite transporter (DMT)-like permease